MQVIIDYPDEELEEVSALLDELPELPVATQLVPLLPDDVDDELLFLLLEPKSELPFELLLLLDELLLWLLLLLLVSAFFA